MQVFEVIKGKSNAEVKRKIKDKEVIKFRCDRINILIINDKREVFMFNKFTGTRIKNYRAEGNPLAFVPERYKKESRQGRKMMDEMDALMKNLQPKDLIALAFFDRMERIPDIKKDFPEIIEAAVTEHKTRFRHG